MSDTITLVSMSGLRVCRPELLELGLRLPGLRRRAEALSQLPPLGLLTVAGTLAKEQPVRLINDQGTDSVDVLAAEIFESDPALVAFSTLTAAANRAYRTSEIIRSRGTATVVGGLHATAAAEECRRYFDAVAIGDGETLFPQIVADFNAGKLQPVYRPTEPVSLAQSPLPRWELLGDMKPARYTLQTARGCPWACSFCAASRLLGPPRAKPIDGIRRELDAICSRSPRPWLELADDNTFAVHDRCEELLDALADAGARWFSESDWRIGGNESLVDRIARSGCRQLLVGIESPVSTFAGMGAKAAELSRVVDSIEAIQAAGIVVNACFIVGGDGETPESIERLGDYLETAPFGEVQLTLQTPFPGTALYRNLQRENRLLPGDWSRYTLFDVTYQPDTMTPEQLQQHFDALVGRVFRPEAQTRRDARMRDIRKTQRAVSKSGKQSDGRGN